MLRPDEPGRVCPDGLALTTAWSKSPSLCQRRERRPAPGGDGRVRALNPGSRRVESNDLWHDAARFTAAFLSPTEVTGVGPVDRGMDVAPIPNLAYYLVVNVLWIRSCIWQKGKASPSRRWLDSNPTSAELEPGCPAPLDDTPSSDRLFGCSVVDQVKECKERPLSEAAPQRPGRL